MMSHRDVAQAFADGVTKGTGSRMFIEGDSVFSYGRHYTIARRYFKHNVDYLFNTRYGSSSTESHRGYVRRAISGSTVLVVEGCNIDNAGEQYKNNEEEMEKAKGSLDRARLHKDRWQERIEELEAQNELLAQIAVRQRLLKAAEWGKDERRKD